MPPLGYALTFIIFFVFLLIAIIVGALGPNVYNSIDLNAWGAACRGKDFFDELDCEGVDMSDSSAVWTGVVSNLDRLNQELSLYARLTNGRYQDAGLTKTITISLTVSGKNNGDTNWTTIVNADTHERTVVCSEGSYICEPLGLATMVFIGFSQYEFNVTMLTPTPNLRDVYFSFSFVNRDYTLFELWFRYVFLFFTVGAVIAYSVMLRRHNWDSWTLEQKWALVLLYALMGYNNPIYPIEILVPGSAPVFINRLLYATFLVLIFLFWLIIFDGVRQETSDQSFVTFYLPKVILLGIFWICGIAVFVWNHFHLSENPAFTTTQDLYGFKAFLGIEIVIMIIYTLWMVIVVARSVSDAQILPYLSARIRFFLGFTISIIIALIIAIVFGFAFSQNNAAEFLVYIALLNLYIYVLAFVYLPNSPPDHSDSDASSADRIGMVRLEEDDNI
ncbi:transmembrane protein [Planoprotostelium fungivorum]|uniref:Transmembrane protein n=1 Tax=Planoprotostelium fungivorum TaxID=1890364 RepID=A0A2P6NQR9_9EUKA|nr:transmembrane protein [Planoprotostelium fungivorum]